MTICFKVGLKSSVSRFLWGQGSLERDPFLSVFRYLFNSSFSFRMTLDRWHKQRYFFANYFLRFPQKWVPLFSPSSQLTSNSETGWQTDGQYLFFIHWLNLLELLDVKPTFQRFVSTQNLLGAIFIARPNFNNFSNSNQENCWKPKTEKFQKKRGKQRKTVLLVCDGYVFARLHSEISTKKENLNSSWK